MSDETTETADGAAGWLGHHASERPDATALVIAWCAAEPDRLGEVALFPRNGAERVLGRGQAPDGDERLRVAFERQRPGTRTICPPLASRKISRQQLRLTPVDGTLRIERLGRCPLLVNGRAADRASLRVGDTLALQNQLLLMCVRRPLRLPAMRWQSNAQPPAFATADEHGFVGESPATWRLRDSIAFAAARDEHVLVVGASGTGKELAARAIHRASKRTAAAWIAHNSANFPDTLIDAELFGNRANYPNPGMPERAGLVGAADGGTLFLDEIGELPTVLQAHLLRVLDSHGEYQRLGDGEGRRSDFRLVAATNRTLDELRHDLIGRLPLRVEPPPLTARREDIPLILRVLLDELRARDPQLGERFFEPRPEQPGVARIEPALVDGLLRHNYTRHVRELRGFALRAMATSPSDYIALTDEVAAELKGVKPPAVDPRTLTAAQIQAALDDCGGNQNATYKALNLRSRDALYRLIKKHGLVVRKG